MKIHIRSCLIAIQNIKKTHLRPTCKMLRLSRCVFHWLGVSILKYAFIIRRARDPTRNDISVVKIGPLVFEILGHNSQTIAESVVFR